MPSVSRRSSCSAHSSIAVHALLDGGLACFGMVELGARTVGLLIPALGVVFIAAMWWMLRQSRPAAA